MSYSAIEVLDEALQATKALLLPFRPRRWLVLAVVVFFVSGTTGLEPNVNVGTVDLPFGPGPGPGPGRDPGGPGPGVDPTLGPAADLGVGAFVLAAAAALVLVVVLAFVASVMEFVFVRIAERRDVRIRGYLGPHVSKGVSLFLLRVLVVLAAVAAFLFFVAAAVVGGVAVLLVLLLLSPVLVVGIVGLYLFHRFTIDFVVPVALVEDVGVFAGWRRFAPELRAESGQYAVYALVRFALGIVAGMATAIGFAVVGLVVALPFLLVLGVLYALEAGVGLGAAFVPLAGVVVALLGVAALVAGVTLVQVPVSTYLRYYSLLVLADVSPRYDLVSEVRRDLPGAGGSVNGRGGASAGERRGESGGPPAFGSGPGRDTGSGSGRDSGPGPERDTGPDPGRDTGPDPGRDTGPESDDDADPDRTR